MRILLAEDEPAIAANIAAAFERAGYATEIATDGEAAWFRGDTEEFDLIVLDLGLPRIDGLTVLKRWRAAGRQTPVLILTARGAWPERVEGIDAGADDYLPKPFQIEELLARVRALIRCWNRDRSPSIRAICALPSTVQRFRSRRSNIASLPICCTISSGSSRRASSSTIFTAMTMRGVPMRSRRW